MKRLSSFLLVLLMILSTATVAANAAISDSIYQAQIDSDPAPLTPQEKLSGTLKARLSWLDEGEVCTVIPRVPQPGNEAISAAIAAKYGEDVARQPYSEAYRVAAQEFLQGYYANAYLDLLKELGYMTEDEGAIVYGVNFYGSGFTVEAGRSEIMRIAANDHVESIELITDGMYVEAGCEKYVDTDAPLFRRFMAWGDENANGNAYSSSVSRFEQLYTKKNDESVAEWAILAVNVGFPPPWEVRCGGIVADRYVYSIGGYELFLSGYALYDAEKDDFVELAAVDAADYPGLYEAIWELGLGKPIGDADFDGKVTILDATHIQRALVNLDDLEGCYVLGEGMANMRCPVADADSDGKITILDATRIQRVLAGICDMDGSLIHAEKIEDSVVAEIPFWTQISATVPDDLSGDDYRTIVGKKLNISDPGKYNYYYPDSLHDTETGYVMLIRSRKDFDLYLAEFDKEGTLDDAFFEDNAVLAMLQHGGADEAYAVLSDVAVYRDDVLYTNPQIFYHYMYDDEGNPMLSPSDPVVWTFLQVKQSDVKDVKTIEFWK